MNQDSAGVVAVDDLCVEAATAPPGRWRRGLDGAIAGISAVFLPIVNLLSAAGILKGLIAALTMTGVLAADGDTHLVLDAIPSAIFHFLPVFVAFTTAQLTGVNPFTAVGLGAITVFPPLTERLASGDALTFLGLPVADVVYPSSVIPVIAGVLLLKYVERGLRRIVPEVIQGPFVPLLSLVVVTPAVLVVLGPLGALIGDGLASGYGALYDWNPVVSGIALGGVVQLMVMFGFHWGLVPVMIANIATTGSDTILAFFGPAVFAQVGAALAVCLRVKDPRFRALAASAAVSAAFGVTEPALFGVNLPLRKPMVVVCLSGAVGGGIVGLSGAAATAFAFPGLASLPVYFGTGFGVFALACVIALVVSFTATSVLKLDLSLVGAEVPE